MFFLSPRFLRLSYLFLGCGLCWVFWGLPIQAQDLKRAHLLKDTLSISKALEAADKLQFVNPGQALRQAQEGLEAARVLQWKAGQVQGYKIVGRMHRTQGDYSAAIKAYYQALKALGEGSPDAYQEAAILNNIGVIYRLNDNIDKALSHHFQALEIIRKHNDPSMQAYVLNSIGDVYMQSQQYDKARLYHQEALDSSLANNYRIGLAPSINNLGRAYMALSQYREAEQYFQKALLLYREDSIQVGEVVALLNLARLHEKINDPVGVLRYAHQALELGQQVKSKERIAEALEILVRYAGTLGNYEQAFRYQQLYQQYRDSLQDREKSLQIGRLEGQFELDKKEKENELLRREAILQQQQLATQQLFLVFAIFVVLVVSAMFYALYQKNKLVREVNYELQQKNEEITTQSQQLSQTNEQLMDAFQTLERQQDNIRASLNYASRIQRAMLPTAQELNTILTEYFVIFKPKDIVSGDFYWIASPEPKPIYRQEVTSRGVTQVLQGFDTPKTFIAVIDCTGHGVPGAFMSMIANDLLNQLILEHKMTEPQAILAEMDKRVVQVLKQGNSDNRDGMDMGLCMLDYEQQTLTYAGAHNTLLRFKDGEMYFHKGAKCSVGGLQMSKVFHQEQIPLEPGTMLYLFSDGIQDQFGGPEGRKFTPRRLRELLERIHKLDAAEQQRELAKTILNWQGNEEQTDDMLLLGLRIKPKVAEV
ncbi:tetratricopeptide repeat protein [Eisenibacter elegans]|uniref:tetratricopeptide repeat protein n=1 Tax=Eisenibacter elegans TaxID=997 RepID=UPI00041D460E|nr:tetratricopeptide repeat protein [Eisenibacter elegans]